MPDRQQSIPSPHTCEGTAGTAVNEGCQTYLWQPSTIAARLPASTHLWPCRNDGIPPPGEPRPRLDCVGIRARPHQVSRQRGVAHATGQSLHLPRNKMGHNARSAGGNARLVCPVEGSKQLWCQAVPCSSQHASSRAAAAPTAELRATPAHQVGHVGRQVEREGVSAHAADGRRAEHGMRHGRAPRLLHPRQRALCRAAW